MTIYWTVNVYLEQRNCLLFLYQDQFFDPGIKKCYVVITLSTQCPQYNMVVSASCCGCQTQGNS